MDPYKLAIEELRFMKTGLKAANTRGYFNKHHGLSGRVSGGPLFVHSITVHHLVGPSVVLIETAPGVKSL